MAAGALVDAAAEELVRGEAGQAEAFSVEVCLVGVPHVIRQSRDAVRPTLTPGHDPSLGQREKSLKSQRSLEDLWTDPNCAETAAAQLARGESQVGGQGVDVDRVPGHECLHSFAHEQIRANRTASKHLDEVCLQDHECALGRLGHSDRLQEAIP
jgi:hypothetical protein